MTPHRTKRKADYDALVAYVAQHQAGATTPMVCAAFPQHPAPTIRAALERLEGQRRLTHRWRVMGGRRLRVYTAVPETVLAATAAEVAAEQQEPEEERWTPAPWVHPIRRAAMSNRRTA